MKMAREGRLRRLHRRDWPGFLNGVVPAWGLAEVLGASGSSAGSSDPLDSEVRGAVLDGDGLVDPGVPDRTVSGGMGTAVASIRPSSSSGALLSGIGQSHRKTGNRPVQAVLVVSARDHPPACRAAMDVARLDRDGGGRIADRCSPYAGQ